MKPILIVGSINTDLVVRAARQPAAGETLLATAFDIFPGGKGANQAVAAARLGSESVMIGHVGSDPFGPASVQALQTAGVRTEHVRQVEGSSGIAVIVVTESGQNSILIVAGANATLTADDVQRHSELIAQSSIVLAQLETPMSMLQSLAALCGDVGVPLMLDPAPAKPLTADLLRRITWLTPNETEAEQLFGVSLADATEQDLRKLADEVLSSGPRNLILKLGARGAYVATSSGERFLLPAIPVQVVDTTAAGDCFNGAFAHSLRRGDGAVTAGRFAIAASALSVTRRGAQPSMPSGREVLSFLASHPSATP